METLASLKSGLDSGRLVGCTHLKLADNLSEFPTEILALADSLTFLNLSNNHLSALPPEFAQMRQLKIVFFNNNRFTQYPNVLASCPQLSMVSFKANQISRLEPQALSPNIRWLILTNNQLTVLPDTIGQLSKLQKLMLAGNQLRHLPTKLANCTNLELIRLSANQLEALPSWLLAMPRLSWLAYAGNPCHPNPDTASQTRQLPTVHTEDLQIEEMLGEGASGLIYKGIWAQKETAVKLFKGDITSDGSPLDEMRACIAAGAHPNLVSVLGKYFANGRSGLVFDFIPPEYKNLGGPPSLETCTRDTYSEDTTFTLLEVLKIATGIASAARHLHSQHIMHGDLYAHNILINPESHCILGDFGAASLYEPATAHKSLEQIEVRAFGCLLEDLLVRCSLETSSYQPEAIQPKNLSQRELSTLNTLQDMQQSCLQPTVSARPRFEQLCQVLERLSTERGNQQGELSHPACLDCD